MPSAPHLLSNAVVLSFVLLSLALTHYNCGTLESSTHSVRSNAVLFILLFWGPYVVVLRVVLLALCSMLGRP